MSNVRINTEKAGGLRAVAYTPYDQTDLLTRALAKDPDTALGAELKSTYATKAAVESTYAMKAAVESTYVPLTRTINGQPLSADVTILARRPGFYDIGDVSGAVTIDAANGTTQALTLTGDNGVQVRAVNHLVADPVNQGELRRVDIAGHLGKFNDIIAVRVHQGEGIGREGHQDRR